MLLTTFRIVAKYSQNFNISRCANNVKWHVQTQNYSKISRTPIAIVNEDEIFEVHDDDTLAEKTILKKVGRRRRRNLNKKKAEPVEKKENNIFTKLKENERILSSVMIMVKSRQKRKKNDRILLEGHRLITDAIQTGLVPETIIYTRANDINKLPPIDKNTKFYKVPYKTIQLWSTLMTPSGLMGIFRTPEVRKETPDYALPLTIICDNIRDPGNLGSILRAAAGVGCKRVILTKGCVDIWESKVLRSGAGAHFRLPIYPSQTWDDVRTMISENADVYVADNNSVCNELETEQELALLNEDDSDHEEISTEKDKDVVVENAEGKDSEWKLQNLREQLIVVPYYSIDYTDADVVIIVGGETEGLSEQSLSFLQDRDGVRVNVPLHNGIESLNTGMALGIIAYEVHRQYSILSNDDNEKK